MEEASGIDFLILVSKDTYVPNNVVAEEQQSLTTVALYYLNTISPLLKSHFLAPPEAYDFIKFRAAEYQLTAYVQPFLKWFMGCLQYTVPGVNTLDSLDTEDRLTSGRHLLRVLVPEEPPPPSP